MKRIEDILAECIEDVKADRCSMEDCLSRYPALDKELEPLLRLALNIQQPPDVKPSTAFKVKARVQIIEQINEWERIKQQPHVEEQPGVKAWGRVVSRLRLIKGKGIISLIPRQLNRKTGLIGMLALAMVVSLVAIPPFFRQGNKALAATMELQSYRMTGSTTTTFEEETSKTTFEMEFVAPDRYHGKITRNEELYEHIIIGNKLYSRELGSDQSRKIAVVIDGSILTIEQTLEFLRLLNDLEELPDEKTIDGNTQFLILEALRQIDEDKGGE